MLFKALKTDNPFNIFLNIYFLNVAITDCSENEIIVPDTLKPKKRGKANDMTQFVVLTP